MSRLAIETPGQAQTVLSCLYRDMGRRIIASQPGLCPVDMSLNFLRLCHAQTCGKCVPCRVGLGQDISRKRTMAIYLRAKNDGAW